MPVRKETVSKRASGKPVALFLLLAAVAAGVLFLLRTPRQPQAIARRDVEGPHSSSTAFARETLGLVIKGGVKTLTVEIADTPETQALGLMFRTALADDQGMLFLHAPPRQASMWMKNTFIPLDMVFIGPSGTVEKIVAQTEPHSERVISSDGEVAAVLELAGGAASRLGLKAGDRVRHRHFSP